MPDLTAEPMEACERVTFHGLVPGSKPGTEYRVRIDRHGHHCTCKAFQFGDGKECKHIRWAFEHKICPWTSLFGEELQAVPGVCPACGGPTYATMVFV